MPRTYNYNLHDLEQDIHHDRVSVPLVRCEAIYSSPSPVTDACIDGFHVDAIEDAGYDQEEGQKYRIVATGSATVDSMKTGDVDDALTIAVVFERQQWNRQSTVSVTLTDGAGCTTKWKKSNEELMK